MIAARRRPRNRRRPGPALIFTTVCGPVAFGALLLGAPPAAVAVALVVMALAVLAVVAFCDRGDRR